MPVHGRSTRFIPAPSDQMIGNSLFSKHINNLLRFPETVSP